MTDKETAAHLRKWVEEDRESSHNVFGWPTDACGYDQHIRFVRHRNEKWTGGTQEEFRQFILQYADMLENKSMTDKFDESKYIHPLARAVLATVGIDEEETDIRRGEWKEAGFPLLTDEAKAILQAVEEAMNACEKQCCDNKLCRIDEDHVCHISKKRLPKIWRAWKEKEQ